MAEGIDKEITDLGTSWEGYKGTRVENFIKAQLSEIISGKYGYTDVRLGDNGLTTLRQFGCDEDYYKWSENPEDNASLVLSTVEFYSSGAQTADYSLLTMVTKQPETNIRKGAENIVKFTYDCYFGSNKDDHDTLSGTAKFIINNTEIKALQQTMKADGKEHSVDLSKYLLQETNKVVMSVGNSYGKKRDFTFYIYCKEITLSIDSSYDESVLRDKNWLIRVSAAGVASDVHLLVDGEYEQVSTMINQSKDFYIDSQGKLSSGAHEIAIYAVNSEYDIRTETLRIPFIKTGGVEPSICISRTALTSTTMYSTLSIPYFLYYPNAKAGEEVTVEMNIKNQGGSVISQEAKTQKITLKEGGVSGMQSFEVSIDNVAYEGIIVPTITVNGYETKYEVTVGSSGVNLQAESECKVYLSPRGKSNADDDAEDWHSTYGGKRTCEVKRSGNLKLDSGNGFIDNSFLIKSRKTITLSGWKPFATDFGANSADVETRTGKSIELEFETLNCVSSEALVASCFDNGVGFRIYSNRAELSCDGGTLTTYFSDEKKVRISFVIDGSATACKNETGNESASNPAQTVYHNLAYIYVNGVCVRMMSYGTAEWKQLNAQEIVIGSEECEVKLYAVRGYDKSLSMTAAVGNYAFDTPSLEDKIAIAKRNNVMNSYGDVTLELVQDALPQTPTIIWDMEKLPTSKKDPQTCDKTEFVNPQWSEGIDGKSRCSFTAGKHTINGDGTSSNNYPLPYKNWAETFEFSGSENMTLHMGDEDVVVTKYSITIGLEAEETEFVHKVNFASCEKIFNMMGCENYHKIQVGVATSSGGNPDLLTKFQAEQQAEGREIIYRHSLSGFPEIGFRRTYDNLGQPNVKFLSIYNFINNKYSPSLLGMSKSSAKNQVWEVDDNINFFMTECSLPRWEGEEFNSQATTLYYARVPKKSLVTKNSFGVAGTSAQVAQAQEEQKGIRRVHNWLYGVNPNVAKRYYLKYGKYASLPSAVTYGADVYTQDTPEYRYAKFEAEYSAYLVKDSAIFYFIFFVFHLGTDSMDKNMSLGCEDVSVDNAKWFILPRDMDTMCLFNNSGLLAWKYYHEWGDTFDAVSGKTGEIVGEVIDDNNNISIKTTAGTPIFNGRLSGLWDCVAKVWKEDIKTMYAKMRSAGLNYTDLMEMYKGYWGAFCENLYNKDAMGYANTGNFAMAYGDKLALTEYFYKYRSRYWDSRCGCGDSSSNSLMLRVWERGAGVALRHYCPIYASMNWGSGGVISQRNIEPNTPTYFANGVSSSGANEVTFTIYDADLITEISTYTRSVSGQVIEAGLEGLGLMKIQSKLNLCKRLKKLIMDFSEREANTEQDNSGMDLSGCKLIEEVVVRNCTNVTKTIDIVSDMIEKVDFRQTPIAGISLPSELDSLVALHLPLTIKKLKLDGYRNLSALDFEGYGNFTELVITGCPLVNKQAIMSGVVGVKPTLQKFEVDGLDIRLSSAGLMWFSEKGARLKGKVTLTDAPNMEQKKSYISVWGDVDSEGNGLWVDYSGNVVASKSVTITAPTNILTVGQYKLEVEVLPSTANDFRDTKWSIVSDDGGTSSIDSATGLLKVDEVGDGEISMPVIVVRCDVNLTGGRSLSAEKKIFLYDREAQVGDYVYADGTFSEELDATKYLLGYCFYSKDGDRRMVVKKGISGSCPFDKFGGRSSSSWSSGSPGTIEGISTSSFNIYEGTSYWGIDAVPETSCLLNSMDGKGMTKKMMDWSNSAIGVDPPTSIEELKQAMLEAGTGYSGSASDNSLFLQMVRFTTLFEPYTGDGTIVSEKFKKGDFYLPSTGELKRIAYMMFNNMGFSEGELYTGYLESSDNRGRYNRVRITCSKGSPNAIQVFVGDIGNVYSYPLVCAHF